jgi:hypothetical protein
MGSTPTSELFGVKFSVLFGALWRRYHVEPCGRVLDPYPHSRWSRGMAELVGNNRWDQDPLKKTSEQLDLIDLNQITNWAGVRDDQKH